MLRYHELLLSIVFISANILGQESQLEAQLVEISKINPRIKVNLIWATGDNHLNLILYPDGAQCYLLKEAAYALDAAQQELETKGYGLIVLEAFRPLWAQQKLWQAINYIPDSLGKGRHTRGASVDVALINSKDGSLA